jgi:hypothetical protein
MLQRPNALAIIVIMLMGAVPMVSGPACAQGVVLPPSPEDQQMLTTKLGSGVVGKPLPSTPIEDVSIYSPATFMRQSKAI